MAVPSRMKELINAVVDTTGSVALADSLRDGANKMPTNIAAPLTITMLSGAPETSR